MIQVSCFYLYYTVCTCACTSPFLSFLPFFMQSLSFSSSPLLSFIHSFFLLLPFSLFFYHPPLFSSFFLSSFNSLPSTGVKLLKEFKAQYILMEKQRQELTNAEKLFDLPITMYPDMIEVDKELRNIGRIFEIYENQKASIDMYRFICVEW